MGIEKKAALVCVVVVALLFGIGLANRDHRPGNETAKAALAEVDNTSIILPVPRVIEPIVPDDRRAAPPEHEQPEALPGFREVAVLARDNYWKIAERELGDGSLFQRIAEANPGVNPKRLKIGQRIRVPTDLGSSPRVERDVAAPEVPKVEGGRRYTIGRNETLSGIAAKVYGRSSRWREIWAANKEVIPDPNRMKPGTTIVLP